MKDKKGAIHIIFIIGAIILLGFVATTTLDFSDLGLLAATGGTYDIEDTKAYPNTIYSEVHGTMECKATNNFQPWIAQPFWDVKNKEYKSVIPVICPQNFGGNCQVRIDKVKCPKPFFDVLRGSVSPQPYYKLGSGAWTRYSGYINLAQGRSGFLTYTCKDSSTSISYAPSWKPYSYIRYPEVKLYLNTEGKAKQGWLDGSSGCKLVSIDAKLLKDIQTRDDDRLKGIKVLRIGESRDIIVGWEEIPGFGNFNPLGQYNGKDVICKPFTSLNEVKKVSTVGGKTYSQQGSVLKSYSGDNTLCCSNSDCAGDYKCEDYQCKFEPTCTSGECSIYQKGQVIKKAEPLEENGKFYLVTQTCDYPCISESRKEVKCTRASCDRNFGSDYFCDYTEGCINVDPEKTCPGGSCCKEGGSGVQHYEVQTCSPTKECCWNAVSGDGFRGLCLDSCEPYPEEICGNEIDDDKDGLIDNKDPDCQICVLDKQDIKLAPKECCEAKGGEYIPFQKAPWYKIFEEDQQEDCRLMNLTIVIVGIVLFLVGVGLAVFSPVKILGIILTILSLFATYMGYVGAI